MARVLGDDGVHHAAEQALAGDVAEIMPDEGDCRFPTRVGDRFGDSGGARAHVVDANQIRMIGNQPHHERFALTVMIVSLNGT